MSYFTQYLSILVILQIIKSASSQARTDTNSLIYQGQPVEYVLYDKYVKTWIYFPVEKDKWTFDGKLKIIIHGFNTHRYSTRFAVLERQLMTDLGQIYSQQDISLNVVLADWTPLATGGVGDYETVAKNVVKVGRMIADLLITWQKRGIFLNWRFVHLIGFSLGAHIAGVVGDQVWRRTGQLIGRISGLDPAGPSFDAPNGQLPLNTDGIVDRTDAQFVDIYHCNMGIPAQGMLNVVQGRFGSAIQAGHVDFYPQGGARQSHACSPQDDIRGCSHKQCAILFGYGIRNPYGSPACPCESYEVFLTSECGCIDSNFTTAIYMGDRAMYYSKLSKDKYFAQLSRVVTLSLDAGNGATKTGINSQYLNSDLFEVEPNANEGQKNPNGGK